MSQFSSISSSLMKSNTHLFREDTHGKHFNDKQQNGGKSLHIKKIESIIMPLLFLIKFQITLNI